jgi:hypothetical protein
VAKCYHRANQAITAEGILQSALPSSMVIRSMLETPNNLNPMVRLGLIESSTAYADLLSEWDKRDADATKWKDHASAFTEQLPTSWKKLANGASSGKQGMFWFYTSDMFHEKGF